MIGGESAGPVDTTLSGTTSSPLGQSSSLRNPRPIWLPIISAEKDLTLFSASRGRQHGVARVPFKQGAHGERFGAPWTVGSVHTSW